MDNIWREKYLTVIHGMTVNISNQSWIKATDWKKSLMEASQFDHSMSFVQAKYRYRKGT